MASLEHVSYLSDGPYLLLLDMHCVRENSFRLHCSEIRSMVHPFQAVNTCLLRSELAIRDGRVRELREERDAVMGSVRQRDSALQVRCGTAN